MLGVLFFTQQFYRRSMTAGRRVAVRAREMKRFEYGFQTR